ncbi:MAG TPA: Clp protease N-terminal domain-containing protein [Longimicrobiales bacterium]|nr:Clp protease N-terminal domain-containing protein [Longimicrobiales bacterium]
MRYDFADETRKMLAVAREEAAGLGHDYVGTEHVLLGLLRSSTGVGAVLDRLGMERGKVRERVLGVVRRGHSKLALSAELPYTSRAKKVLEFAMAEARDPTPAPVGWEHMLLGLLREEKGIAAQVLTSLGATLERTRAAIRQGGEWQAGAPLFAVEIDDTSETSIYEQIVARIQEAIATGELAPGTRLPAVRRLADQLDIAPGTVARAYSELEALGLVVTDGARGTRVAERKPVPRPEAIDAETLAGLFRPVAVAAFHMGAAAADVRAALEEAMTGIY